MARNLTVTILVVAALALGACSDGDPPDATSTLTVEVGDCSRSFQRYLAGFIPDMVAVAHEVGDQGKLAYFCADGSPIRTADVQVVDFSDLPPAARADNELAGRLNAARATGLERKFTDMAATRPKVAGSGLLEALEASCLPNVTGIYFFTDAMVNAREDGVDLAHLSRRSLKRVSRTWAPRLAACRGADLTMVGVGKGAPNTKLVRKARTLFLALAKATGMQLTWTQSLAAI